MPNIIVRKGREHFDIRKTPTWDKALAISRERQKTMTDAELKDARHNYNVNERNLPGLPPFFPREVSPALTSIGLDSNCSLGHRWSNTIKKFCIRCFVDKPVEQGETI